MALVPDFHEVIHLAVGDRQIRGGGGVSRECIEFQPCVPELFVIHELLPGRIYEYIR